MSFRSAPLMPVAAVLVLAAPLAAADAISTDRPGFLFATSVLEPGGVQLEAGVPNLVRDDGGGVRSTLINFPTVLRLGLGAALELQVGHSLFNHAEVEAGALETDESGLGDLALGLKWAAPMGESAPQLVLVGTANVPTGDDEFSSGRPAYFLNAVAGWDLGGGRSLSAMAGYARAPEDGGGHAESGAAVASLGFPLGGDWGGYVEAGHFPGFGGTADTAFAGGGVTWRIDDRLQLDAFFDRGLNSASPDWMIGAGVSVRFRDGR